MPPVTDLPRAARLWRDLSDERRMAAAQAFWEDEQSVAEQVEVVGALARRLNFRPKTVMALPLDRKVRYTAKMTQVSDGVAARLLVAYHLHAQRPMMGAFLDALGIAHTNGVIEAEQVEPPSPEALAGAVQALRASYPEEDVRLYFQTLVTQDPATWGGLIEHLAEASAEARS